MFEPHYSQHVVSLSKTLYHNYSSRVFSTQVYKWIRVMLGRLQARCGGGVASPAQQKMNRAHSFQERNEHPDLCSQAKSL